MSFALHINSSTFSRFSKPLLLFSLHEELKNKKGIFNIFLHINEIILNLKTKKKKKSASIKYSNDILNYFNYYNGIFIFQYLQL